MDETYVRVTGFIKQNGLFVTWPGVSPKEQMT